jgi:hypothetical protein
MKNGVCQCYNDEGQRNNDEVNRDGGGLVVMTCNPELDQIKMERIQESYGRGATIMVNA